MRARAKIDIAIARLQLGNTGDSKPVGEGVHEVRINYGPGYRLYYGHDGQSFILLLCGGDKKSQKKDIENAREYWQDYRLRKNPPAKEKAHEKKTKR